MTKYIAKTTRTKSTMLANPIDTQSLQKCREKS